MPTVREGLSLAVLEAMACGLPVVASACSSLPEQIDNGMGGFLCPVGDVVAFAEKIKLTGRNILKGEYRVQTFIMIIKKRTPSLNMLMPLFPDLRIFALIGTYFTVLPFLKTLSVKVVGYEYVLGKRYSKL